ncbi:hypothetical protein KIN20_017524 [Parelaphostrongylus tenuis]|uniref:G-protein coupled receptors family 1 profile domain-containing protein n=1 Tax=Parelaphostrongylus tenuis TaxID=148309 RepID=A0AAD5QRH9_PARTN|nr:hypothetical protein KIN20_017524 [Parelaphostrongylus tenuis]
MATVGDNLSLPYADQSLTPYLESVTLAAILLLLILSCVIGNAFVIAAIIYERDLRNRPQYYLIFSLAVADLIVGIVVTPLGAWSTVAGTWRFGVIMCDVWISVDVIVCTASILHLVAIALDRYWSVTNVSYSQNRTGKRIIIMLAVIWLMSLLISLAPFAGWKDDEFKDRVLRHQVCLISQQISYQVFSTATAFYIPLIAIICIYWKIMKAARKRFKRERDRRATCLPQVDHLKDNTAPLIEKRIKHAAIHQHKITSLPSEAVMIEDINEYQNRKDTVVDSSTSTQSEEDRAIIYGSSQQETKCNNVLQHGSDKSTKPVFGRKKRGIKETVETKRERKAYRTLAIITGTFVACWTPFFLVSLYRPICRCSIPRPVETVTAWLGYLNSALNPIIYTVFSHDFRIAFKKIIKRICLVKE